MTEWNASGYQGIAGLQEAIATDQIARLRLQGNEQVLDVGCGNGKMTAVLAERVPDGGVIGIDASRNMIDFAQQQYASSHPNLRFVVADARDLGYDQAFDLVVSFNALHWVPDLAAALCSIHNGLKPTGHAVLRFVPAGERQSIEAVIETVCQSPAWRPWFAQHVQPWVHPTPAAFRVLAGAQGLRVIGIEVEDRAWDFQTREAFGDYCRVTLAEWTRRLPEAHWDAFISDVLDHYQVVAADTPTARNTFRFYQLEAHLAVSAPGKPAE